MSSGAREKREELLEKKRMDEFVNRIQNGRVLRFHRGEDFPSWIQSSIARIRKMGSYPQDHLSCDAEHSDVLEWMKSFLRRSSIHGTFHLSTGLRSKPWAEFEPLSDAWLDEFTQYRGHDLCLVSKSLDRLVIFFEEEYRYEAFCSTEHDPPAPTV